ncbi:thiamine phosphate synthase [Coralliovum pocilloporae]|uniref:thiamine phosphate synthase n=1 Tax=Coralliovum pocilloporae TaxID=3066369 RepID=UPI003306E6FA
MSDINRIYLITPSSLDPDVFCPLLDKTLDTGGVAAVLISLDERDASRRQSISERISGICHKHGVAAILHLDPECTDDSRIAGRARLDGVHSGTGEADLENALDSFAPQKMVGAGNLRDRHTAMTAGELDPDYVFFGLLERPDDETLHDKTFDLAVWWAQMFEIPAVAFIGLDLADTDRLAAEGVEFIAAREAVWSHPDGPESALKIIQSHLASHPLEMGR